jgi:hypothetical protein
MPEAPSQATSADDAPPATSSARGAVALVWAIFASELGAALLFVVARQPALALLSTAVGITLALGWAGRHHRRGETVATGRIAAAREALAAGKHTIAWNIACAVAAGALDRRTHRAALTVMVKVAIEEKDLRKARALLARMGPPRQVDPLLEAAIELASGRADGAIRALRRGRERPVFGRAAARQLVELCAAGNDLEGAVAAALDCIDLLAAQDLRNMIASLEAWGAPELAGTVAVALALRAPVAAREISLGPAPDPLGE